MFRMAALLALLTVFVGCSSSDVSPVQAAPAPAPPPAAANAAEASEYTASGPVIVENQIDVVAARDGMLEQVLVEAGAFVKKGQLLARLDDRQLRADRDAAEAKLRSIEADVQNWQALEKVLDADMQRAEEMHKAQLNTKQDVEHIRYKKVAAFYEVQRERENARHYRSTLQSLDLELEKTRIVAPFDGIVARRYIRAAQQVKKDDRLFWVSATAPLRVVVALPQKFAGTIRNGATVSVTSEAAPELRQTARVVAVSPIADPASGTIELTAELTGSTGSLKPGMTATIHLPAPR